MPRIDPLQLLRCLSVLLSPEGGILSRDEVPRLVNLMTKFSKKLVSKCVYILILKNTDEALVNLFMSEGGWALIQTWLQDAMQISNWDLVKEILNLLLITPVDVERLKLNNIPKLVKSLSRLEDVKEVQELAQQLVHNWLLIVKSSTNILENKSDIIQPPIIEQQTVEFIQIKTETNNTIDSTQIKDEVVNDKYVVTPNTFYKVTIKDGKQIISRTGNEDEIKEEREEIKSKESDEKKEKKSSRSSSKHSSSSSRSNSSSRSSSSKHKSSSKSSSSSSSSSSKDRNKKDRDKYKDKHKNNGKSTSSKDKSETKEKQAEKDKDTLAKIKPQTLEKLGRIPKKTESTSEKKDVKKPTMSIEVRKMSEERPKTVKVFNSKRRQTGLEEEAKPPPPRPVKKVPPTVVIPPTVKRPTSPTRDTLPLTPPEKKIKVDLTSALTVDRPGAIKLIPPKPKPPVLQESDIFMDALTASASTKKETKKRKRRLSASKETPESPTISNTSQEATTPTSPLALKNIGSLNFYQDTLETENSESTPTDKDEDKDDIERVGDGVCTGKTLSENGLKGVLVYSKKKGPKKSVRFNDGDLTQVRYFELDETERVNVTKNFMDMAKMEMTSEREALQTARKLPSEDLMEPQTMWRIPYFIDQSDPLVVPGSKSLEKDIQFAREKSVLQALYFDRRKIPDSPDEPIPENHQMNDPIVIPLEDADSQEMDLRNTPWPEPKGSPPPLIQEAMPPQIFNNMQMPFQNFPNMPPPGAFHQGMPPRFGPNQFGPNIIPNGIGGPPNMGPPHPDIMHQGPIFLPPNGGDNFNPMMNDNYPPMPFNNPNIGGGGGMFPPNFNNRGRGGFRRGGGNAGPWLPMNRGGNWNRGGSRGGRFCKNIKNHGFCRNMDKCPFVHPNK